VSKSAISFLFSAQNTDGGWGYRLKQDSAVEPTSAALLALRAIPSADYSFRRGVNWLKDAQHGDGGWGFSARDIDSAWQTAWAVLALLRCGQEGEISGRGVKWLLGVSTFQDKKKNTQKIEKISMSGWPWLPGEAVWIEPTALAILALDSVPDLRIANDRIKAALRYIQDQRCFEGGWNVGAPGTLNSALPARAHPTAWVLLALLHKTPKAFHSEDIHALRSEMHRDGGASALAWGLLALRTLKEDDKMGEARLTAMQGENGGWDDNPYITAVALMAMRGYL
jgi:hypothetical protein